MSAIYDTTTTEYKTGLPYTVHTVSHTVTTIENRALIVFVTHTSGNVPCTATWNGTSMTNTSSGAGTGSFRVETFYLMNPDSGTHDCTITWTTSSVVEDIVSINSIANVYQTGNPSESVGSSLSSGTSVSELMTTPEDNSIIFVATVSENEATLTGGETIVSNENTDFSYLKVGYENVSAGENLINATQSPASQFNIQGISFSALDSTNYAGVLLNFI